MRRASFRDGTENVYLHPLRVGAHVIAGTVLGHVGSGVEPHIVFQIRPAGIGAPLVDPKPILDGWVKLQSSSVVKAKGRDPFAKILATPGQALLESKTQLEQQVPREDSIHLAACERRLIADGRVDRRVLATLAFLSASGLRPTVSSRGCAASAGAQRVRAAGMTRQLASGAAGDALDISAIDGTPVVGPSGQAPLATLALRKLAALQGVMKPLQIASATRLAGAPHAIVFAAVCRCDPHLPSLLWGLLKPMPPTLQLRPDTGPVADAGGPPRPGARSHGQLQALPGGDSQTTPARPPPPRRKASSAMATTVPPGRRRPRRRRLPAAARATAAAGANVRLAAFGAIAAVVVILLVLVLGGSGGATYHLIFPEAGQLVRGDQVQVGGVPVGSIKDITLLLRLQRAHHDQRGILLGAPTPGHDRGNPGAVAVERRQPLHSALARS